MVEAGACGVEAGVGDGGDAAGGGGGGAGGGGVGGDDGVRCDPGVRAAGGVHRGCDGLERLQGKKDPGDDRGHRGSGHHGHAGHPWGGDGAHQWPRGDAGGGGCGRVPRPWPAQPELHRRGLGLGLHRNVPGCPQGRQDDVRRADRQRLGRRAGGGQQDGVPGDRR